MYRPDCAKADLVRMRVVMCGKERVLIRTAGEWAEIIGVNWETIKKRRQRGDSWSQAIGPLRRSQFNRFRV